MGTGWSWLRIGTGGGRLWVRWWTFGFHKMRGISWLAAKPVTFSRRTLLHGASKLKKNPSFSLWQYWRVLPQYNSTNVGHCQFSHAMHYAWPVGTHPTSQQVIPTSAPTQTDQWRDLQTDNFHSEHPKSVSQQSPFLSVRISPKTAHFSVRFAMQSRVDVNYRRWGIFMSRVMENVATDSERLDSKQYSFTRCYLLLF